MELDMKTLVHVGTELLIITGLGMWMNNRIRAIEAGFSVMDKNIKELQEMINKQNQIIMAHDQFLKHLAGVTPQGMGSGPKGGNPPPGPIQPNSRTGSHPVDAKGDTQEENPDSESEKDSRSPQVGKKNRKKDRLKKDIKELTQEDIDRIIQDELRNELNQKEEIEVETNTHVERDRSFKHKKKDK